MRRFVLGFLIILLSFIAYGGQVNCPLPLKKYYTIQVFSSPDLEVARGTFESYKNLPFARIEKYKSFYRVRIGFFLSEEEAKSFVKSRKIFRETSYFITYATYHPERVVISNYDDCGKKKRKKIKKEEKPIFLSNSTSTEKLELKTENNTNDTLKLNFQPLKVEEKKEEKPQPQEIDNETFKKENGDSSKITGTVSETTQKKFPFLLPFGIFVVLLLLFFLFLRFFFGKKRVEEKDFEVYVTELLEKGDYDELERVLIPYVGANPEDVFAKRVLAEVFEKKGKFLEAAELYKEAAEILKKRDLIVLAKELEEKREKLLGMEFK